MARITAFLVLCLLLTVQTSHAMQLRWSSGASDLTFTSTTRCVLIVQADSAEVRLPSEWILQWLADSSGVNLAGADSLTACEADTAKASAIDPPSTPADSAEHQVTAHFCSDHSSATTAYFVLDQPGGSKGKLKVVAIDPTDPDSSRVIQSSEATYNGGVGGDYPPVILRASSIHKSPELRVTIVGSNLGGARSLSMVASDSSWNVPLNITSQGDAAVTAIAQVAAIVPACVVQAATSSGIHLSAPLGPDVVSGPQSPEASPSLMIEHFQSDPVDTIHMQPKDFSMTWAIDGLHIFYIRQDMATIQKYGTGLGSEYTSKNFGHVWTPDFVTWHWDSLPRDTVVLQVDTLSSRWDNWHVWAPSIIQKKNDIIYRMFYTGVQRVGGLGGVENQSIGVATSVDLVHWDRQASPVLTLDDAPWTPKRGTSVYGVAKQLRDPFVFEYPASSGHYLMYFVAVVDSQTSDMAVGVARSSDLSIWRADAVPLGNTRFHITESPHVFPDSSRWWMFYTTGGDPVRLQTTNIDHSPGDSVTADWSPTPAERLYDYLNQDQTVSYWHASEHLQVASHEYVAAFDDRRMAIDFSEMVWYGRPGQPLSYNFVLGSASTAGIGQVDGQMGSGRLALIVTRLRRGSPEIGLRIELPSAASVRLQVFDVMGRRRGALLDGALPAGATDVAWDGRDGNGVAVGSGIYFVRLSCGRAHRTVKVLLLR